MIQFRCIIQGDVLYRDLRILSASVHYIVAQDVVTQGQRDT